MQNDGVSKTITVRNVPDRVLKGLRRRARRSGRSLQAELLDIVSRTVLDEESFARVAAEFRAKLTQRMTIEDIEAAIDAVH